MIKKLRIGKIPYLNLFPFYYWLENFANGRNYEFIKGVPSEVNKLIECSGIRI